MNQSETSLLYRFLMAQKKEPRRGDWYSDVQNIIKEFNINMSEEQIKETKTNSFKGVVKEKAFLSGIRYLKAKQEKGEKGSLIKYNTLELQDYLQSCANISLEDQQLIFSFICEMNVQKSNFRRNMNINIEYCIRECKQELDNTHLTWCNSINKKTISDSHIC